MSSSHTSTLRHCLVMCGLLFACLPHISAAQSCGDEGDCKDAPQDRWTEQWKEERFELPPLPEEDNLLPIDANLADPRYEYLLDKTSISKGKDGVMRYTIVVRSQAGARNVFHEGIRCETDEARTYAYAGTRGSFSRSSDSRWRPVARRGVRGYQEYLASVIVCNQYGFAWEPEEAARALGRQFTSGGVRVESSSCRDCMEMSDERRND